MTDPFPSPGKASTCHMLWKRVHLTLEGYLTLCCVDYENSLTYADLNITPLKEAWNNQLIQQMRKRHQSQSLSDTLCQNCLYGTQNKVFPISTIGHKTLSTELTSTHPKGIQSIETRIEKLIQLEKTL